MGRKPNEPAHNNLRSRLLTVDQIAARLGEDVEVIRTAIDDLGLTATAGGYGLAAVHDIADLIRDLPPAPEAYITGNYTCAACGAFCGVTWSDGTLPDGPECDRSLCPARMELGPPTIFLDGSPADEAAEEDG